MHTSSSFPPPPLVQGEHLKRVSHVPTLTNQKKAPSPHNPHYSFHPPLQKINQHSFESAMRNPNFQFDIFNIPFVEKPLPPQSRTVHPPSQYISRGIFEGPSYWRWHMLLLAFSDDPHRTVLRQLPPPSFPY